MTEITKRCGCRKDVYDAKAGKWKKGGQLGDACPQLDDEGHGKFGFRVSAGTDPETKNRRVIRKFIYDTRADAEGGLLEVRQQVRKDQYIFDNVTVKDYLERWLKDREENTGLKASTARMYRAYIRNDIGPALGHFELRKVTKPKVAGFIRKLQSDGRGATTVRRIHATLSSAFADAVSDGEMIENLCHGLRLPKVEKTHVEVWSRPNLKKFRAAVGEHRMSALFETALSTGMRRGELCGLRWSDVDFKARTITVRTNLVQVGKSVVENSVKTEAGHMRVIPMGKNLIGTLMEWELRQAMERTEWAEAYEDSGRVFTYEDGHALRPGYPSSIMTTTLKHLDVPKLKFHGLRHQFASSMLAAGMPIAVLSKIMGHATINITIDLYGHMVPGTGHEAMDAGIAWMELTDA